MRRLHRWLGIVAALFVILLSLTGIALNHSDDWGLGRRYVSWNWLLNAYGITAPVPETGFASGDSFAALLAGHVYFDQREVAANAERLAGFVMTRDIGAIATADAVLLVTRGGDPVDRLDVSSLLPSGIERLGISDERLIVSGPDGRFVSDPGMTRFAPWQDDDTVTWSEPSRLPADLQVQLREQYRGRGLTVERLLADLHSGRFVGIAGPLLLDLVAIILLVLSLTGVLLWSRRRAADNGRREPR